MRGLCYNLVTNTNTIILVLESLLSDCSQLTGRSLSCLSIVGWEEWRVSGHVGPSC